MADEVFSGGVSVTGVEPGTTTITIKSTTNPNISKKVPVTVKSRNLLAYGPASGNGLTATVNSDGSLHVTGTAIGQWRGLSWTFPCPVQGTVKLSGTSIAGLSFNIKCLDAKGQQLGDQMNLVNSVMAIPPAPSACSSTSSPPRPRPPRRSATSESSWNPALPRTIGCDPTTRALVGGAMS